MFYSLYIPLPVMKSLNQNFSVREPFTYPNHNLRINYSGKQNLAKKTNVNLGAFQTPLRLLLNHILPFIA